MKPLYWDKICPTCLSVFDKKAIQILQKRPDYSVRPDRKPHLSRFELLQSAKYCHLCEWITASVDMDPVTIDGHIDEAAVLDKNSPLSVVIGKILHGIMGLWIYGKNNIGSEILAGTVLLSPVTTQKRENAIARRLTPRRMLTETTISQIQLWTADCRSSHNSCNNISKPTSVPGNRPGRLLEILEMGLKLRLKSTETISSTVHYATLSHCWGDSVDCRLTEENIHTYCQSIPLELLPRTFRECMQVVCKLGFQYLWIDALCIIQDSKSDWLVESSKMGDIYAQSALNIAATASKNGRQGLFRSSRSLTPCILDFPEENGSYPSSFVTHDELHHFDRIERSPLNQRGWVLQERILSPRTIHFALGEVFWECHHLIASETLPDSAFLGTINVKSRMTPVLRGQEEVMATWHLIVSQYSKLKLTRGSDKLPALSGLANRIALCLMLDSKDYLAGLWRVTLVNDLLWRTSTWDSRVVYGRSPSWSWARVDGEIHFVKNLSCHYIRILDAEVERIADPFGAVGQGFVSLQGPLCRLKLTGTKTPPTFFEISDRGIVVTKDLHVTILASEIDWDDWVTEDENRDKPLYLLICDIEPTKFGAPNCTSLVLQAIGAEHGQYARLGVVSQPVASVDDLLSLSKSPKLLERTAYKEFNHNSGFTITIH